MNPQSEPLTALEHIHYALIHADGVLANNGFRASCDLTGPALISLTQHEKDLAELFGLCCHATAVYRAHGYNIAADHMSEVLSRFEVSK